MNEIITRRDFNVPVEMLFKAWSQAHNLQQWWGPEGFTNTFYAFDFRKGGKWVFTMHGPDGKGYENESIFESIRENELIVLHHISKPEYRAEFNFSVLGSHRSLLVWKMVFMEQKSYDALKDIVTEKNEENLNRLEAVLKKIQ
jgi:uncharacterized protein YndB with AHSA1/START domain